MSKGEINWRAFLSQFQRKRLDDGLKKLGPFLEHRIECESPEQVALTILGIAHLLIGQEKETAALVCDAAKRVHDEFEDWKEQQPAGEPS